MSRIKNQMNMNKLILLFHLLVEPDRLGPVTSTENEGKKRCERPTKKDGNGTTTPWILRLVVKALKANGGNS